METKSKILISLIVLLISCGVSNKQEDANSKNRSIADLVPRNYLWRQCLLEDTLVLSSDSIYLADKSTKQQKKILYVEYKGQEKFEYANGWSKLLLDTVIGLEANRVRIIEFYDYEFQKLERGILNTSTLMAISDKEGIIALSDFASNSNTLYFPRGEMIFYLLNKELKIADESKVILE